MMSFFKRDVPDVRFRFPPGLMLSADPSANGEDSATDGFLSSSEIGLLDLDADLVILSACNTASDDTEFEVTTFSGLSQAFTSAGAKTLVVSHWNVISEATEKIITTFIRSLRADTNLSTAAALKKSMAGLLESGDDPHPFLWGPFFYSGLSSRPSL